jgi:tetratricopeptide (TPR) repeat protein
MLRLFSAILQFRRGQRSLDRSDFPGALFHFSKVIQASPRNYFAYHNRGTALQGMGSYASSIDDFDQAIRLHPRNPASYGARGISRKFVGNLAGAIEDQTHALALDPKLVAAHAELAAMYFCSGDFDRALIQLTIAMELDPDDLEAPKLRGFVQFCRGKFEASAADLQRALALGQDPYAMLFYYLTQTRLATAGLDVLALGPAGATWPAPIFDLYRGRRAAQTVLDAAATAHQQAEAHFYIGAWHLIGGDRAAAISALTTALRSLPPWFIEHPAAKAELARLG